MTYLVLRLHGFGGRVVRVNAEFIVSYSGIPNAMASGAARSGSRILLLGLGESEDSYPWLDVQETPEELDALLSQAGEIKATFVRLKRDGKVSER